MKDLQAARHYKRTSRLLSLIFPDIAAPDEHAFRNGVPEHIGDVVRMLFFPHVI